MTIFVACASVLVRQLEFTAASAVLILTAGIAISLVILGLLVRGILRERERRLS